MSMGNNRFLDNLLGINMGKIMSPEVGLSEKSMRKYYNVHFSTKKSHKIIYKYFFKGFKNRIENKIPEVKFLNKVVDSIKSIPSFDAMVNEHIPIDNKRIKDFSIGSMFDELTIFLSNYYYLLKEHGYLKSIIINEENKDYVFQIMGALLVEAGMDDYFTKEYVDHIDDYDTPMKFFLKDTKLELIQGCEIDLRDYIPSTKKYNFEPTKEDIAELIIEPYVENSRENQIKKLKDYKKTKFESQIKDANRKELERWKQDSYYEQNPNGIKYFEFIESIRFKHNFAPYPYFILSYSPFVYTKFIINQKSPHNNNKNYKLIMSDFNDAIEFLSKYKPV